MSDKKPTKEQLEKLIEEATETIDSGTKWLFQWQKYRIELFKLSNHINSESGTTPSGPVPPTPPGSPKK